ncbi:MAG: hypothetical protein HYY18_08420 [Planctomycetes bacterium]|nr:hypothetical protein [Planctomycetota bacterium]
MTPLRAGAVLLLIAAIAGFLALRLRTDESEPAVQGSAAPTPAPGPRPEPPAEVVFDGLVVPSRPEPARAPDPEPMSPAEIVKHEPQQFPIEHVRPAEIGWLLAHQNEDGSFGAEEESFEGATYTRSAATALAILAMLSHGYTHLSKEVFEAGTAGEGMKRAYKWMIANGSAEDPLSKAITTMAWTETYGMTNSAILKPQAVAALERLVRDQGADGSWGDAWTSAWAAQTLRSAEISALEVPEEAKARAAAWLGATLVTAPDPAVATAYTWVSVDRTHPGIESMRRSLLGAPPSWRQNSFTYWYFGTVAMRSMEEKGSENWKAWTDALRTTIRSEVSAGGEWGGGPPSVLRQAFGALCIGASYESACLCPSHEKKKP